VTESVAPRPGEATHVWIPPDTADRFRAMLPAGVEVHVLPRPGEPPRPLGPGQFVVADFYRADFLDVLSRIDDVHVVQTMSAGIERYAGRLPEGIVLCDGAGIHDIAVADWVVMAILAMLRGLPQHVLNQSRARWMRPDSDGMKDLDGATVVIAGYGSIGRAVEARLLPFGARIERVTRHPRPGTRQAADLPALLPTADVVVILLPLTPETELFVNADFLSRMRPGALLVNASRGRVVDTDALMQAIRQRGLFAALDVTDPEPLPDGHPLWTMEGVLITPHVAGSVERAYERAWRLVAEQLRRYVHGEPLKNVVSEGY